MIASQKLAMTYVIKILTMNFIIALILSLIFCQSCTSKETLTKQFENEFDDYYIINEDSCQYIVFLDILNHKHITHRGRCEFCKQRK